jgi:hypothetical protein
LSFKAKIPSSVTPLQVVPASPHGGSQGRGGTAFSRSGDSSVATLSQNNIGAARIRREVRGGKDKEITKNLYKKNFTFYAKTLDNAEMEEL